jgi:hypothetical protein
VSKYSNGTWNHAKEVYDLPDVQACEHGSANLPIAFRPAIGALAELSIASATSPESMGTAQKRIPAFFLTDIWRWSRTYLIFTR